MNKLLVQIGYALGGLSLFVATFFVFAVSSGKPLGEMAVLGNFLPDHPEPDPTVLPDVEGVDDEGPGEGGADDPTPPSPLQNASSVLGVFQIPAPLTNAELQQLTGELKSKLRDLDGREQVVASREEALTVREQAVEERYEELTRLRSMLEQLEAELDLRREEVQSAEAARAQNEAESWRLVAKMFEAEDADEIGGLANLLQEFTPEEAAQILLSLDERRAGELLQALPTDRLREYFDAWRLAKRP